MLLNAAEKLGEFMGIIDIYPKLSIFIEELPVPEMNIWLHTENGIPKAYGINHLLENKEAHDLADITAVYFSSYEVRLRAQVQFPVMELFPDVDVRYIGSLRNYMLEMMGEGDQNNEVIDCQTFSQISCFLYERVKNNSFPVIRRLARRDARYTAQELATVKVKIKG
jgi:hypothetical protein